MKFSLIHHGLGDWEVRKLSFSRLNGTRQFKISADVVADRARSRVPRVAARLTVRLPCPRVHVLKRRRGRVLTLHSLTCPPSTLTLTRLYLASLLPSPCLSEPQCCAIATVPPSSSLTATTTPLSDCSRTSPIGGTVYISRSSTSHSPPGLLHHLRPSSTTAR